jgi:hypothetical protein
MTQGALGHTRAQAAPAASGRLQRNIRRWKWWTPLRPTGRDQGREHLGNAADQISEADAA